MVQRVSLKPAAINKMSRYHRCTKGRRCRPHNGRQYSTTSLATCKNRRIISGKRQNSLSSEGLQWQIIFRQAPQLRLLPKQLTDAALTSDEQGGRSDPTMLMHTDTSQSKPTMHPTIS